MTRETIRKILLGTTILGCAFPALAQDVPAQDNSGEREARQEIVVVTGSRLANTALTATSPVTTVGADDLSLSNTVNSEQFLNALPQVIPGFDSTSNNPGLGEATVDLRGLGANRTLVLVNGRRYVTSNQNAGVVDLNTIPAALIEKIDILTGGASAVYGSDAIAGVVNFTLRDDFEGLELDTTYEATEEGDGAIWNTSLTLGGDFAGGRGNGVISMEYTSRESVLQGDRPESAFTFVDTGAAGGLQETGSVNIPSTFVIDGTTPDFTDTLGIALPCSEAGTAEATDENGDPLGFCTTASGYWIFAPGGAGVEPFIDSGPDTSRYNYAPANYLQIPQERYSVFAAADYAISDAVEAYGQAIFVSSQTEQLLAPTPVFTSLTINLDNPFLANDPQALALLTHISDAQTNAAGEPAPDSDGNGVNDAVITYRTLGRTAFVRGIVSF